MCVWPSPPSLPMVPSSTFLTFISPSGPGPPCTFDDPPRGESCSLSIVRRRLHFWSIILKAGASPYCIPSPFLFYIVSAAAQCAPPARRPCQVRPCCDECFWRMLDTCTHGLVNTACSRRRWPVRSAARRCRSRCHLSSICCADYFFLLIYRIGPSRCL